LFVAIFIICYQHYWKAFTANVIKLSEQMENRSWITLLNVPCGSTLQLGIGQGLLFLFK